MCRCACRCMHRCVHRRVPSLGGKGDEEGQCGEAQGPVLT